MSVAEAIDAAVAAVAVGLERERFAEALAATLVKDEGDRAVFDVCFARVFPVPPRAPAAKARRHGRPTGTQDGGTASTRGEAGGGASTAEPAKPEHAGADGGAGDHGDSEPAAPRDAERNMRAGGAQADHDRPPRTRSSRANMLQEAEAKRGPDPTPHTDTPDADARSLGEARDSTRRAAARLRTLRSLPFASMSPRDVEEAAALVRTLARQVSARLRRRLRSRRSGRLDFRRTLRAATSRGGVPVERYFRGRQPRRPTLVALCDLSVSAASATDFLLALLAPARTHFGKVRLFGFVDRLVEIGFVGGNVRPAASIDLMARSDFGRVLRDLSEHAVRDLTADTVLLILGDARNNRRPPRADLLRQARARVRRAVWLNPEPVARWNSGDSVIALYARHVDVVVPCGSLAELAAAVTEVARR